MLTDRTTYAPLTLLEYDHEPGSYCLMMADADWDDTVDVFEECGAYGNGHSWEGVARQAVRAHVPGEVMQNAVHDHGLLAALIRGAEPEWLD